MEKLTIQQEDINQVDYIDLLISNQRALEKKYKTDFEGMRERGEKITFKSMFSYEDEKLEAFQNEMPEDYWVITY